MSFDHDNTARTKPGKGNVADSANGTEVTFIATVAAAIIRIDLYSFGIPPPSTALPDAAWG